MSSMQQLMAFSPISVVVCGLATGVVILVLSYWISRRRSDPLARPSLARNHSRDWIRRCAVILAAMGIMLAVTAPAIELAMPNEGLLTAEDAFTLRGRDDFDLDFLTPAPAVDKGDLLARLRSPELSAESVALQSEAKSLRQEQAILKASPLEVDPNLANQQSRLDGMHLHYLAAIDRMQSELNTVRREYSIERLEKTQSIMLLERSLRGLEGDLLQARAELTKATRELEAQQALFDKRVAARQTLEEHREDADFAKAAYDRISHQIEIGQQELTKLKSGLDHLSSVTNQQDDELTNEITEAKRQLAQIAKQSQSLETALVADRSAAEQRRIDELTKLEHEIAKLDAERHGIAQSLAIVAPFAGEIAYRSSAPNSVLPGHPLIVLAAPNTFSIELRLPIAEASSIANRGQVILELEDRTIEHSGEIMPQSSEYVVRRFPAEFHQWQLLDHDPGMALVEMTAFPPGDAVRDLALGTPVFARLAWMAPLHTLPLFLLACGIGLSGMFGAYLFRARTNAESKASSQEIRKGNSSGIFELDRDKTAVTLLGTQLREELLRKEPDPALLATIEWVIERQGLDAVKALTQGLGDIHQLLGPIQELLTTPSNVRQYPQLATQLAPTLISQHPKAIDQQRLAAILSMLAPSAVVRREQRADQNPSSVRNGPSQMTLGPTPANIATP